jgi:6-pyruvoyltetrahydropterin/6-carboxytetrahydropterin synthase
MLEKPSFKSLFLVTIWVMSTINLVKTFQFEAAQRSPYADDPARLHGHSYTLDLVVEGPLDSEMGWVMDYADISKAFAPIYNQLDHQTLNDLEGITDTSIPKLRNWIFEHTKARIPMLKDVHVEISGSCAFAPQSVNADVRTQLPDRIRFGFEAAHSLNQLPQDHKCHTMHGHSFLVDVAASDLTSLNSDLKKLYDRLDHRCLNDIDGLEIPTSEVLAIWIWNSLAETRSDLTAVMVAETCTARCIYHGQ